MDKALEKQLIDEFPTYFRDIYGDPKKTCMSVGCAFRNGWFAILHNLCSQVQVVEDQHTDFYFLQLKEKFGIFTAYCSYKSQHEAIGKLIRAAAQVSSQVCEKCASEEDVTTEGQHWVRTWCKKCAEGYER